MNEKLKKVLEDSKHEEEILLLKAQNIDEETSNAVAFINERKKLLLLKFDDERLDRRLEKSLEYVMRLFPRAKTPRVRRALMSIGHIGPSRYMLAVIIVTASTLFLSIVISNAIGVITEITALIFGITAVVNLVCALCIYESKFRTYRIK